MKLGGRSDADVLEQALTGSLPRQRASAETMELVALADGVRSLSTHITPRPEFRESLRARLVAEASVLAESRAVLQTWDGERTVPRQSDRASGIQRGQRSDPGPGPVVVVIGRGWRRAVAGVAASALVVGGATAVAATGSMPGDLLYPVKRGVENLQLRLGTSDAARGAGHLDLARQRLNESERLIRDADSAHVTVVGITLDAFEADTLAGERLLLAAHQDTGDDAPLNDLNAFVADVVPQLQQIRQAAAEPLHDQIDALLRLLGGTDQILTRTLAACGQRCADLAAERERAPLAAPSGGPTEPGTDSTSSPADAFPSSGQTSAGQASAGHTSPAPGVTASTGGLDDPVADGAGEDDSERDRDDVGRAGGGGDSGDQGGGGVVAPALPGVSGSGETRAPAAGGGPGDAPIASPISPPPVPLPSATSPGDGSSGPVDPALPAPPDPEPDPPVPDPGPVPDPPVPDPDPIPNPPVPDPGPVPDPPDPSLPGPP